MTIKHWLSTHYPVRGGHSALMRASGVSYQTIAKAVAGIPIAAACAQRIADATDGEISYESLVCGEQKGKVA